jgi:hypothetical protein
VGLLDGELGRELGVVPGFFFLPRFQLVSGKVDLWACARIPTLYPVYVEKKKKRN